VAQAAREIGVDPTALYPVIRRLEQLGRLRKLGRELHPPR
jgi:transposase-like protein